MKTYDYIIELRRPGYFLVDMVSRFMLLIAVACFAYTVYWVHVIDKETVALSALIVGIVGWVIRCYRKQQTQDIVMFRVALLMGAAGWFILTKWNWQVLVYTVAALAERQVKFPREIAFDEEGVLINSLPKKFYPWSAATNVMLKDGILTIDLKNNKLIQRHTESGVSFQDEQDFNEFCRRRLGVS